LRNNEQSYGCNCHTATAYVLERLEEKLFLVRGYCLIQKPNKYSRPSLTHSLKFTATKFTRGHQLSQNKKRSPAYCSQKHPTYIIVKSFEERVFSFYSRTIVNSQRLKTKGIVDVFETKAVYDYFSKF